MILSSRVVGQKTGTRNMFHHELGALRARSRKTAVVGVQYLDTKWKRKARHDPKIREYILFAAGRV